MHELLTPVELSESDAETSHAVSSHGDGAGGGLFNLNGFLSNIGSEEILLIGLIILLLAENADIELIIILAFLLLSGM